VSISIVLLVVMAVLYASGIYLMLERSMTRVLMGFLLVGNATNLLIIAMVGSPGTAPIVDGVTTPEEMTDPLPEALILTAIVITFGVSAFLLALIYRSWRLAKADILEDDVDDIALRDGTHGIEAQETSGPDADDTEFGARADAAVWNTVIDDETDIRNTSESRRRKREERS
jgi:multisubunit Na+/H+ antiporter MnhC subunit